MKKLLLIALFFLGILFLPHVVFAHEVYVLHPSQIEQGLQRNTLNVFTSLQSIQNIIWFLFFGFLAILSLGISFIVSFSKWGTHTAKSIEKLSKFALPIIRIVLGISLIYSAHYGSLFGPELPLAHLLGGNLWSYILYLAGVLVVVGLFTRIVSIILLLLFLLAILAFHDYMITYVNYLGEMLVLLLVGGEAFSLDSLLFKKNIFSIPNAKAIVIPILRISFGISLLYAALYVKFLHPALSYDVVRDYHLTKFFPFDPLFIVFGAGCIELVIAFIFLVGVNMRWNILFFAFWAILSLIYFGESVWPHYILFGISIGLYLYGYDQLTLEKWMVKKTKKLFSSRG